MADYSVEPNTDVYLYSGVSLDKSYNHTLCNKEFYNAQTKSGDVDEQVSKFSSYLKKTFNDQTYQRAGKNKIRVRCNNQEILDCNYMIFTNVRTRGLPLRDLKKTYFAFIDSTEYINEHTTEISYTIDVMQTWYFDYELGSCYIEREHTETDEIGEHIVPENLGTEELTVQKTSWIGGKASAVVVYYVPQQFDDNEGTFNIIITGDNGQSGENIVYTSVAVGRQGQGNTSNGLYNGYACYIHRKTSTDENFLKEMSILISTLNTNKANIVALYQVPPMCLGSNTPNYVTSVTGVVEHTMPLLGGSYTLSSYKYLSEYNNESGTIGDPYTPINKKLLISPYQEILVTNYAGSKKTYKRQYFDDKDDIQFQIESTFLPAPEAICYPLNYKHKAEYFEDGVSLTDFPKPAWSEDSYTKWLAQTGDTRNLNFVTGIISTAGSTIGSVIGTGMSKGNGGNISGSGAGNMIGTGVSGAFSMISQTAQFIGEDWLHQNELDEMNGTLSTTGIKQYHDMFGFGIFVLGIAGEYAKMIDDYFSMYGYAIKRVKMPNISNASNAFIRPIWNYIKTGNCVVHSTGNPNSSVGLPAGAEEEIENIYNHGITFWDDLSHIGDYSNMAGNVPE